MHRRPFWSTVIPHHIECALSPFPSSQLYQIYASKSVNFCSQIIFLSELQTCAQLVFCLMVNSRKLEWCLAPIVLMLATIIFECTLRTKCWKMTRAQHATLAILHFLLLRATIQYGTKKLNATMDHLCRVQ